ncbi:hypothetical protein MKB11_005013 [Salmonella enterica]|nr:hypothetical protein [Salmonella enterica]
MEYLKVFREAGQPTAAAPLELCELAQQQLSIWRDQPLIKMHDRINRQIAERDRFEFLAVEGQTVKAMMIICIEREEIHTGEDCLYTMLAFSPEPGFLKEGYKAMRELAKELQIPYVHFSRHPETFRKVKQ